VTPRHSVAPAVVAADLRDIRPLVAAHAAFERSAVAIPTDWAERTARLVAAGRAAVFVARHGREAVGYASTTTDVATWTGEEYSHLDCVFVAEARRGGGVGRLLLDAATQQARSRGHRELQWQTPRWNADAIGFYERLGATHQSKERFTLPLS